VATIDHVTVRVCDLDASLELFSQSFELLVFGGRRFDGERFHEWNDFSIAAADDGHPPTGGSHIGFAATSRAQVDGWWEALTTAGYRDDGALGPRPEYWPTYYGAFVRDPDGELQTLIRQNRSDRARWVALPAVLSGALAWRAPVNRLESAAERHPF